MRTIECPYCRQPAHPRAVLCPHCRSPLGLVAPLTQKVASLEAEVARLRALIPPEAPDQGAQGTLAAEAAQPPLGHARAVLAVALAIALNLVLHLLLLFAYDLPPLVLRMATLAGPAMVCCLAYRGRRFDSGPLFVAAGVVALVSVLGMLGITSHLDAVPFWPQTPAEWREMLEYTLAIALGHAAGGFLSRALDVARQALPGPSLLVALFKRDEAGRWNVELVADRINHLWTTVTPLATGALAVYSGVRSLVG